MDELELNFGGSTHLAPVSLPPLLSRATSFAPLESNMIDYIAGLLLAIIGVLVYEAIKQVTTHPAIFSTGFSGFVLIFYLSKCPR